MIDKNPEYYSMIGIQIKDGLVVGLEVGYHISKKSLPTILLPP